MLSYLLTLFVALFACAEVALSQHASPASSLSVPQLTAQRQDGIIELRWPAVPGALRYELWSWTSAGGWLQLGGDDLTDTSFTHTGISTSTAYDYQIRAVGAFGDVSEWSQPVHVTVPGNLPTPALSAQARPVPTPLPGAPPRPVDAPPPHNDYGTAELTWDAEPSWSPDGSKIAFESRRNNIYDIYVMNADGSGLTRLTRHPSADRGPSWSPSLSQ